MNKGVWNSTFIIMGPAYSGISTLTTLLCQEIGMINKDTRMVRVFDKNKEIAKFGEALMEVPRRVKAMVDVGAPVPSCIPNMLFGDFMSKTISVDCTIVAGYPSTKDEAVNLHDLLGIAGRTSGKVIVFNLIVNNEDIINRIDSSNKTTMKNRVLIQNSLWFSGAGKQTINYLKSLGNYKVVNINASLSLEEMFHEIMDNILENS